MAGDVEAFIARWQGREGGQERANYALYLSELCIMLGVRVPDPASSAHEENDYVFERVIRETGRDGVVSLRRIDLYCRDRFLLEAKQSRQPGEKKELGRGPAGARQIEVLPDAPQAARGRRGAERSWDVLMMNARWQAENYVRWLPAGHVPPPFVIVCDVGHCMEIYANFRRDGKAYDQFPDRQSFRVYLEDLRDPDVRERLARIWTEPEALDPARHAARVTREIALRLAEVSKALERQRRDPEQVAMFLMRLLFTMFAEDIDLIPGDSFKQMLVDCEAKPEIFPGMLENLWRHMDEGGFIASLQATLPKFNGEFFKDRRAFPLGREEIGELRRAAEHDWKHVEPAIFGTLLEQALDPAERRRLGAHYTPRAYVERLVTATVIEPLRLDWTNALATALQRRDEGRADAAAPVAAFHARLCRTRVLDPACGTGNFLYVALELVKRLEGEVLEALVDLGGQEALRGLETHSVDPKQFLGLEKNARAAPIAELVLWIGHLQWHYRTRGGSPTPPILKAYHNIKVMDAVLESKQELARDENGRPVARIGADGKPEPVMIHHNPRRPAWPEAEFIVGNPPFIGGKDLRARLGEDYAKALWAAHPDMNESADFVMYWWDRAAEILGRPGTALRRFGLVTTNSISQVFQRRVMERRLKGGPARPSKSRPGERDAQDCRPITLVMAVPDHPWTKAGRDAAAVRIAMTVAEAGEGEGVLREVTAEDGLETDAPVVTLAERAGRINSDLTVGVDVTACVPLRANAGVCSPGVKLHGAGFIVTPKQAEALGIGRRPGLEQHIREYRNGRDLMGTSRGVMVIDLFGLEVDEVRARFPEVYQHLLVTVKPERDKNARRSYRDNWWVFGEPRRELRPALLGAKQYISTVETSKHRVFQLSNKDVIPDNMIVVIALEDRMHLAVLSARASILWALRAGGWLGIGNDPRYSKSRCFDPFPFPACDDLAAHRIGVIAEELDAHRKARQAEHPEITLTDMYNVLERLRAGTPTAALAPKERRIFDDGLVLILRELHDRLDAAVAAAYGWPADLADEEILARLVALNRERAEEERRGLVRWLRPDYQIPRFGSAGEKAELDLVGGAGGAFVKAGPKPMFPIDEDLHMAAVTNALFAADGPLDAATIARGFRQGRKVERRVEACLVSLYRMGVATIAADGRSFAMRRAA